MKENATADCMTTVDNTKKKKITKKKKKKKKKHCNKPNAANVNNAPDSIGPASTVPDRICSTMMRSSFVVVCKLCCNEKLTSYDFWYFLIATCCAALF
jgi:hypothetical protein